MLDRAPPPDPRRQRERRRLSQRAYRARVKACRTTVTVELGARELDFLIATRWLSESDAGRKAAIGAAVTALIADSARRS
jgi:hypothetical protein